MSLRDLLRLAAMTVTAPQDAWARLEARAIPRQERWLALVVLVVLSTMVAWAMSVMLSAGAPPGPPPGTDPTWDLMGLMRAQLEQRPLTFAAIQMGWMVALIGIVTYVGRLFGGRARYDDVLLAAVWMKAILLAVQLLQLVLIPVSMALAALLALAETILYLLLAVRLTQVVHGFRSPARVGLVMVIAFFVIIFALALRLVLFGPTPPEL